jgi:hypothetical protein
VPGSSWNRSRPRRSTRVDKLLYRHNGGAFDLDAVEVVVTQQKILVFPKLVAFDQVPAFQLLAGFSIRRDHLDSVASLRIDHIEPDRGPVMPGVPERDGAGDEGEAQVTPPDRACGHSSCSQWVPGLTLPLGLAGLLGIRLVVLGGIFEPCDLVAEGIIETCERILHARRGLRLRKAHLMLGDLQGLKHPVFVITGECERILIWHKRKDSGGARQGKGMK